LTARDKTSASRGTVDVWLEFKFKENVPANTTAYCLIIYNRVIEYSSMSNARLRNLSSPKKYPPAFFLIYEIKSKILCGQAQSPWPTFIDLQGFIVEKKFIVKEVAVLRKGAILSHYIFTCHGTFWQSQKSSALPGWVLITMDCNGKTG